MKYLKNFNTEAEYLEYIASADNLPHISYIKDINKVRYNGEVAKDEPVKPKWTGHADAEGLRAIGWTEEDIQYYQENGVNWNAEDDQYHKVSEDNKALYGVLTANNISSYKDRIVYLPKIDINWVPSYMFNGCYALVAIPSLDISRSTSLYGMFGNCYSLVSVPPLDTSNVTNMTAMFSGCYSLVSIPPLDTSKAETMDNMFNDCRSLVFIPKFNINGTNLSYMVRQCYSLVAIPYLDMNKVTLVVNMFSFCCSLTTANLANLKVSLSLDKSALFSKESLLYIINNEAAESAITITLHSYAYERLAEDADVVAALANHPNISIAK